MNCIDVRTSDLKIDTIKRNNNNTFSVEGEAIVFNAQSQYMGFYEIIKPEAVRDIDWSQTLLLYDHDYSNILARCDANNLNVEVRDNGVYFSATLPNTELARNVYENLLCGNLKGCSFGFNIADGGDEWTTTDSGEPLHIINRISNISELSITPIPAYTQTSAAVTRSLEEFKKGVKEMAEKEEKKVVEKQPKKVEEKRSEEPKVEEKADVKLTDEELKRAAKIFAQLKADEKRACKPEKKRSEEPKVEEKEEPKAEEKAKQDVIDNEKEKLKKDGGKRDMAQVIKKADEGKSEEVRNFEHWLKGEKRDLTQGFKETPDGQVVIPEQILDMYKVPDDPTQLAAYVNRVNVTAPSGRLPILAKTTIGLATAAELEENPNIANATISKADYALETMRGMLPISMEMVQDYPNITSVLSEYVQQVKKNTEQKAIGAILQKAPAKTAKSVDDIKEMYNSLINYGSDRKFVVTNSMYTAIDTLKNGIGDYMLNSDLSSATGKSLLGADMIIVPDEILGSTGDKKMFVGSIKAFALEAVKGEVSLNWTENRYFEQVLGVAIRMDVVEADTAAGYFVTYTPATTSSSTGVGA